MLAPATSMVWVLVVVLTFAGNDSKHYMKMAEFNKKEDCVREAKSAAKNGFQTACLYLNTWEIN